MAERSDEVGDFRQVCGLDDDAPERMDFFHPSCHQDPEYCAYFDQDES